MSQLPARSNPNAMIQIGNDQIAVRVEGGFITAAQRKVRLYFGPHLYSAAKGTPRPEEKVVPFQPGYMLLAAAMGATLVVPPSIKDPVTGQQVANPQVELVPGSSVIRSVKATAVCVARDNFGKFHASIQTITVDSESVLRQALLKIERDDVVQVLSDEEIRADKAEGKLRGWVVVPFMPGYSLAGKATSGPIREALQTYNNLSATIRQRACTKAERLACDHNPVLRLSWTYGDLLIDVMDKSGKVRTSTTLDGCKEGERQITLPYAEVDCVAWTESRDQAALQGFVDALIAQQGYEGVETTVGASVDVGDDGAGGPDDDAGPEDGLRQITEQIKGPELVIPARPEPVLVKPSLQKVVASVAPGIRAVLEGDARSAAPAAVAGADPTELFGLRVECITAERSLPPSDLAWARSTAKLSPTVDVNQIDDTRILGRYLRALTAASEGVK